MTFGERLKLKRREQLLTIRELATKSGLTPVSITNYEHDYRKPNTISICKLAKALGTTYEELVGENELE